MTAIPSTSISLPGNPFIGESVDLTLGFDNTGTQTGYGPFVLFYVDTTGADGDDGLTFNSATYLGSAVTTTEYQLSEDPENPPALAPITFNVFGVEQTIASSDIPSDFSAGDTLVVMELPFGSFVVDQPQADIAVNLTGSDLADLNTPINLQSQGGFVFGNTATEETDGSDDPIYENISGDPVDTVTPQLVTLTKNYIGPEDETATGPNFVRQFELVVDIADGQTIENLDVTDILPDDMQFVDVVSIVDSNGTINSSRITDVATPDDDGLTSIGSVNVTENDVNSDGVPTPGGTLTRRIDSVTGTSGERDLVLTYEFFIPRLDANSNVIIDAVTGDDIISTNESQLGDNDDTDSNNTWNPVDPRDPEDGQDLLEEIYIPPTATDPNDPTHDLEDQSIAIQKSVSNITDSENSPGDVLEYTIDFQVSDYFAFQNIDIFDTFSDGQRFDTSFTPTFTVTEHGQTSTTANFDLTNYIVDESQIGNDTLAGTDGTTEVTFEISDELITRNFDDDDGKLIGGGVIDGSSSNKTLYNNPDLPQGATEGQIVFRTVIQQEYSDTYISGDASVDIGDQLDNSAIINGEVLDIDTLEPVLDPTTTDDPNDFYQEADDTSAAVTIEEGKLYKSIYAINGEIYDADGNSNNGFSAADDDLSDGNLDGYANGVNISPGDEVTYRLTYELPTTDVEDLTLTDYFPLPIYDAETEFASTTFDPTVSSIVPSAGATKYGPLDTFSSRDDAGGNNPNLTFSVSNDGSNKLTYSYADFDDDENQSSIVDILVTVTAYDEPAADGLLYTNQVRQTNQTTFNENSFLDEIIQVTLDQPEVLEITKGVVAYSSDNTDIAFDSPFTAPNGVTFATGSGINFATGADPISSSHLDPDPNNSSDDNPIDSNLTGGLEAGDLVTFAITVENTGNSRTGVFDITLQDDLPTGFKIPDAGLNLNLTDGTGATIGYTGLDDNDGSGDDLFGTGIELVDPGSDPDTDAGAISAYDDNSGENLAIVTFDLEVDNGASYLDITSIDNTATLVSYANTDNNSDVFAAGLTDSATVEIETPTATKSITATSETHTDETGDGSSNANARKVTIGEIVRYRLVAEVPEGKAERFILQDRLPNGQTFLDDGTAQYTFISNNGGITSSDTADSGALELGLTPTNTLNGNDPSNITNTDWNTFPQTAGDGSAPNDNYPHIGSSNSISDDPDDYTTGADVRFKFGDLTNSDRDSDSEYVVVEFNALVDNNNDGDDERNDAGEDKNNNLTLLSSNSTSNDVNIADSDSVQVKIVEPSLSLTKEVGSNNTFSTDTFAADAGDTVQFKLTFSNAGNTNQNATAFDVSLTDAVPTDFTLTGIDSVSWDNGDAIDGSAETGTENSVSSGTNIVTTDADMTITPTFDTGTGAISVDVDQMPTDAEISVIYSATVDRDVNPDELITNTADITYSSLPGDDTDGTDSTSPGTSQSNTTDNPTGSDVNDTTSGDTLSERNGDSTTNSANDYSASASGNVQIDPLVPTKTLVSTSENATSSESNVTIGEIVRYQLSVEIPEGDTAGFTITDDLPAGLTYIGNPKLAFVADGTGTTSGVYSDDPNILNNPQVTDSSFTNPTYDLTTGITDASGDSTFTSGEDVTFSLGNITNADDDTDEEYVVVEFNALVENIDANDNGDTLANSFQVSASSPTQTQTSNSFNVTIAEPILGSITHTASPETGDAGDTITYTVTFSNDGSTTAYDLNITDTLPAELDNLAINSNSVTIFDNSATPQDVTSNFTVNTTSTSSTDGTSTDNDNVDAFDIDLNELPANYSVEIQYTATIVGDITTEASIDNTVDVTYSSLPGEDLDGTDSNNPGTSDTNPTGSDVNDTTSGNADSERNSSSNGEGTSVNNYAISSTETVTVDPLVPVKRLVATSESHTADDDVAIGEIVRYQLEVKIPEGETNGFSITDNLPAGLKYLGNPKIAFIADRSTDGIDSTTITDADPNTAPNLDLTGTTATTPEFDLTTGITDAGGDSIFTSGEDVTFSLGDLTNSDRDSEDDEYVVIEFNALVENVSDNTDGGTNDPLRNEFTVSATGATDRTSNPVDVDIVEPSVIDVSQTVSSTTADAGDPLTYTVTFSNTGTADAFDLNLTDTLPTGLDNLAVSSVTIFDETNTAINSPGYTDNSTSSNDGTSTDDPNADVLDIDINQLPVGYSVEIQYTADVVGDIAPESEINSTVDLTYTSLDGTGTANNDTGSDNTAATSGDADGERNGSGTGANTYTDSNDTATSVTINSLNAVKTLASTSETSTTNSDVIIGETVRYQLAVELPEGQTDNFKITDAIPNGITYSGNAKVAFVANDDFAGSGTGIDSSTISGSGIDIEGSAAATPTFDLTTGISSEIGDDTTFTSGEDVTFDLGNLTNTDRDSDSEYVVIEFDGIVDGVGSNASLDNTFTVTAGSSSNITATSGTTTVDVTLDYGDAPDSGSTTPSQGDYLTLASSNGASHGIRTGLTIGTEIDADGGNLQNTTADADDSSDTGSTNDEDGVESFSILETGADSYTVDVEVLNNTGESATLVGWIDFNRNGNFESEEAVIADVPDSTTTANPISLIWDRDTLTGGTVGDGYGELPNINEIVSGDTYARFRLSTDADLDDALSTGIVDDGEVEDYQLTIYNTVDGNPYSDTITEANNVPDLITAGEGQDTLTGGTGEDIFVYTKTSDGVDIIEDFEDGTDKIDLSALVASGGELDGITFTDDPFTDGYVEAVSFGSHTMIQVDFDNSDTLPKDVVLLNNINSANITAADFIFQFEQSFNLFAFIYLQFGY